MYNDDNVSSLSNNNYKNDDCSKDDSLCNVKAETNAIRNKYYNNYQKYSKNTMKNYFSNPNIKKYNENDYKINTEINLDQTGLRNPMFKQLIDPEINKTREYYSRPKDPSIYNTRSKSLKPKDHLYEHKQRLDCIANNNINNNNESFDAYISDDNIDNNNNDNNYYDNNESFNSNDYYYYNR